MSAKSGRQTPATFFLFHDALPKRHEILGAMPSLERVLIYDCADVTDAGLAALAELPRLREVVIEFLPQITPEGLAVFPLHVRVNLTTGEC